MNWVDICRIIRKPVRKAVSARVYTSAELELMQDLSIKTSTAVVLDTLAKEVKLRFKDKYRGVDAQAAKDLAEIFDTLLKEAGVIM